MSEYLGIRVAMLDAIQRYQATPDIDKKTPEQKKTIIQGLLKAASSENGLLEGDRKELVGEAWSRLIGARSADAVVKFVEHPEIATMARNAEKIQPQAKELTNWKASLYIARNGASLSTMVTGFEDIAKSTGVMYQNENDTVSANIERHTAAITAERGLKNAPPKETPELSKDIRSVYDNKNGKVEDKYLAPAPAASQNLGNGLTPAAAQAASAAVGKGR